MDEIVEKTNCCGCGACSDICPRHCITMNADSEGFIYPHIEQNICIDCHLCQKACPALHMDECSHSIASQEIIAATNCDQVILNKSSSGGVFLELCKYVIAQSGIVAGAIYDQDMIVRHEIRETMEGCLAFSGSKYAQSRIDGIFSKIKKTLQSERLVLFSGLPCQIAGLKRYLKKEYSNLLTCDLVCSGVTSPLAFEGYIRWLEDREQSRIISICMKDKSHGWLNPQIRIEFVNKKTLNGSDEVQVWQRAYNSALYMRPLCYNCPYTSLQRTGDITLGDFWAVQAMRPTSFDPAGVSLVLLNTERGKELFSHIKKQFKTTTLSESEVLQSALTTPKKMPSERSFVMESLRSKGFMAYAHRFRSSWLIRCKRRLGQFVRNIK